MQAGLSDVQRQAIQQKLQAEIQAKKEEHLTVYRQSSVEREEDMHSMTHTVAQGHEEVKHPSRPKAKSLKSMVSPGVKLQSRAAK